MSLEHYYARLGLLSKFKSKEQEPTQWEMHASVCAYVNKLGQGHLGSIELCQVYYRSLGAYTLTEHDVAKAFEALQMPEAKKLKCVSCLNIIVKCCQRYMSKPKITVPR